MLPWRPRFFSAFLILRKDTAPWPEPYPVRPASSVGSANKQRVKTLSPPAMPEFHSALGCPKLALPSRQPWNRCSERHETTALSRWTGSQRLVLYDQDLRAHCEN